MEPQAPQHIKPKETIMFKTHSRHSVSFYFLKETRSMDKFQIFVNSLINIKTLSAYFISFLTVANPPLFLIPPLLGIPPLEKILIPSPF